MRCFEMGAQGSTPGLQDADPLRPVNHSASPLSNCVVVPERVNESEQQFGGNQQESEVLGLTVALHAANLS